MYYKDYSSFNLNKYEFRDQPKKGFIYQEPRQLLLSELISQNTIYDNILMFFSTGVGKTAAAITIAESFKEYVLSMDRKIVVLVKNSNIEKNFRNELLSNATEAFGSPYHISDMVSPSDYNESERNRAVRQINKTYSFITYGSFVNRVLGMKLYEKDLTGSNTKNTVKINGVSQRKVLDQLTDLNNTVIIIDEAHNVTNNDVYLALEKVLSKSFNYRLVLLTATPMYDNPKEIIEISNLLNMNHPENLLPIRNELFKGRNPIMVKIELGNSINLNLKGGNIQITEHGKKLLNKALIGKISYLEANKVTFPNRIDIGIPLNNKPGSTFIVPCEMSDYQFNVYTKALALDLNAEYNQDITLVGDIEADENLNGGVTVSKSSSLYKNSSDASTFAYPNELFGKDGFLESFEMSRSGFIQKNNVTLFGSELKKYSSKFEMLLKNLLQSKGISFVYSNYVNYGGTGLIKHLLLSNGYHEFSGKKGDYKSFVMYDDSSSSESRELRRQILNASDNSDGRHIKIIIGSPIISEGITLKNIRQVHILEPAWNMSRINQIIGRAIRNYSHMDLPPIERNVSIYKYVSVYKDMQIPYIDIQKYTLSEEKDRSNKEVERLLKEIAIDCSINKKIVNNGQSYSPDCDYRECDYECNFNSTAELDKSTYNMYISFFERFDIEYITNFIKKLYKKFFVWKLSDIIIRIHMIEPSISVESIYTAINSIIENKSLITDQFNRRGFLIQKGDLFIFNPNNVDIATSLYGKMLDFNVQINKYNLQEYSAIRGILSNIPKKEKKIKKADFTITDDIINYNDNLIERSNGKILGTYRDRGTKTTGVYGPITKKFRIIDLRKGSDDIDDARKNISGMVITSFDKSKLIKITKFLKISQTEFDNSLQFPKVNIDLLDKKQIATVIEVHLLKKKMVLN